MNARLGPISPGQGAISPPLSVISKLPIRGQRYVSQRQNNTSITRPSDAFGDDVPTEIRSPGLPLSKHATVLSGFDLTNLRYDEHMRNLAGKV
jgi:hypothetical protein